MNIDFLQYLIKDIPINKKKLVQILTEIALDDADTVRLLAYLTDFTEIPLIKNHCERITGSEFISYTITTNEVTFKYIKEAEIKVNESLLENKVYDNYQSIPRSDEGLFKKVQYYITSSCTLEEWLA